MGFKEIMEPVSRIVDIVIRSDQRTAGLDRPVQCVVILFVRTDVGRVAKLDATTTQSAERAREWLILKIGAQPNQNVSRPNAADGDRFKRVVKAGNPFAVAGKRNDNISVAGRLRV